jgi:sugar/nucleoside kinase (ribokinase family)
MTLAPVGGLLVIGDLMLDVIATPDPPGPVDVTSVNYVNAHVDFQPGGTGLSMARAAVHEGWTPLFLLHSLGGRRGPTGWISKDLQARLSDLGVTSIASVVPDADPGVAVIGYFGDGRRMMFGSPGANGLPLQSEAIDQACAVLQQVRAVLVSGYVVFRASTAPGALHVMAEAHRRRIPVVLDVVPHSVARAVPLRQFEEFLTCVDFVSCELNTLLAFHGETRWPECGALTARNVIDRFLQRVEGVLAYPEFRHYQVANRTGLFLDGWLDGPTDAVERRGLADRFLVAIMREHFVRAL